MGPMARDDRKTPAKVANVLELQLDLSEGLDIAVQLRKAVTIAIRY